jgi:hypothetical protein
MLSIDDDEEPKGYNWEEVPRGCDWVDQDWDEIINEWYGYSINLNPVY